MLGHFRRRLQGEPDGKGGAAAGYAVKLYGAAMPLDDAVNDGEAQAGPFPRGFSSEKRFEYLVLNIRGNTGTGIR